MSRETISSSLVGIRKLAVARQHLAGRLPKRPAAEDIVSLIRDLPFVQWDPVTVVAPSHIISLWSRLGAFRTSELDRLMWHDKRVFLHWTPIAFLVLTEDYPI
ncbi:MAG TPA: crosslink repair DNA glycosylase YcaQ family protein, partial [Nitrososphaerales archaeon]|nr:crosslink repair DNA glycosylase YcaQ family protein [Nitrososphaerales archaeon]